MANHIQKTELTDSEIQTLAQAGVIPAGTPAAIVKVFAVACQQHGLSPFKKEIYLVKYSGRNGDIYSNIVGIDGLRAKADRTGQLAGKDDAKFDLMPDGSFKTSAQLIAEKQRPTTCTVTVYRAIGGIRCPFTKTVIFKEYCPASPLPSSKWITMPFNQIEKCAEAHALRMGFASETAGLNVEEESAAIQDVTIQAATINKGKETPALSPENAEMFVMVKDYLEGIGDFQEVMKYYQQFKEGKQAGDKIFVQLFFEAVAKTANTKQDLTDFYNEAKAWQKSPDLVKILSTRKTELERK